MRSAAIRRAAEHAAVIRTKRWLWIANYWSWRTVAMRWMMVVMVMMFVMFVPGGVVSKHSISLILLCYIIHIKERSLTKY